MTAWSFIARRAAMAIVEITQSAFALYKNIEPCRSLWPKEHERAWFSDTAGRVVGVLIADPETGLWAYNICQLGTDRQYKRVAHAADFTVADMARLDLVAQMREMA